MGGEFSNWIVCLFVKFFGLCINLLISKRFHESLGEELLLSEESKELFSPMLWFEENLDASDLEIIDCLLAIDKKRFSNSTISDEAPQKNYVFYCRLNNFIYDIEPPSPELALPHAFSKIYPRMNASINETSPSNPGTVNGYIKIPP